MNLRSLDIPEWNAGRSASRAGAGGRSCNDPTPYDRRRLALAARASQQAKAAGSRHGLRAPFDGQLLEDVLQVGLHRLRSDTERASDLLVRAAVGDQGQDLVFAT